MSAELTKEGCGGELPIAASRYWRSHRHGDRVTDRNRYELSSVCLERRAMRCCDRRHGEPNCAGCGFANGCRTRATRSAGKPYRAVAAGPVRDWAHGMSRADGASPDDGELLGGRCAGCQGPVVFLKRAASPDLHRALCPFCGEAECRKILSGVILRLVTALIPSGRGRLVEAIERLVDELRDYEM